jgi:hypothetical protein
MNTYLSIDSEQLLFRKLAKPLCHYFIQNATRFAIWFLPFARSNMIGPFSLLPELHLHCGQKFTAKHYIPLLLVEFVSKFSGLLLYYLPHDMPKLCKLCIDRFFA